MATKPAMKAKKAAAPAKKAPKPAIRPTAPRKAASKAAVRGAEKKAETITLKLVFEQLAQQRDMPKKHGHEMMEGMIDLVTAHLKKGDRVRMSGLGILHVKDRPARLGRNPATGESIQIAASKKVAFRPAKELKEAV
jgi:DNA-binding protein HU-beta